MCALIHTRIMCALTHTNHNNYFKKITYKLLICQEPSALQCGFPFKSGMFHLHTRYPGFVTYRLWAVNSTGTFLGLYVMVFKPPRKTVGGPTTGIAAVTQRQSPQSRERDTWDAACLSAAPQQPRLEFN